VSTRVLAIVLAEYSSSKLLRQPSPSVHVYTSVCLSVTALLLVTVKY